jgi:hypothetical protein
MPNEASDPATASQHAMWMGSPGLILTTPILSLYSKDGFGFAGEAVGAEVTPKPSTMMRTTTIARSCFIGTSFLATPFKLPVFLGKLYYGKLNSCQSFLSN